MSGGETDGHKETLAYWRERARIFEEKARVFEEDLEEWRKDKYFEAQYTRAKRKLAQKRKENPVK